MKLIAKCSIVGVTVVDRKASGKENVANAGDTFETTDTIGAKLVAKKLAVKVDGEVPAPAPVKGKKSKVVDDDMDI